MAIRTTVVISLPRLVRSVDWTDAGGAPRPWSTTAPTAVVCRTMTIRVDLERLTADLDEEARRMFGPSTPPRLRAR